MNRNQNITGPGRILWSRNFKPRQLCYRIIMAFIL